MARRRGRERVLEKEDEGGLASMGRRGKNKGGDGGGDRTGAAPPPVRHSCFFKFMIGDFNRRLRIPVAAKGFFCDSINEFMDIEDTDGQSWSVRVALDPTDETLCFEQGWPEFVSAHSVRVGELVLFMPVRKALLCTQIFSTSACRRLGFSAGREKLPKQPSDSPSRRLRTGDDRRNAGCDIDAIDDRGSAKKKRVVKTEENEPHFAKFEDQEPIAAPGNAQVSTGSAKDSKTMVCGPKNLEGSPFVCANVENAIEEMLVCEVPMGERGQSTNTICLFELLHPETTAYSEPGNLGICPTLPETTALPRLKIDDDDQRAKSSSEASREVHAPENPESDNGNVPCCISETCMSSSFPRGNNDNEDDHITPFGKSKHALAPPSIPESLKGSIHQPEGGLVVDSGAHSSGDVLGDARTVAVVPDACPMQSSLSFRFSVGADDSSWIVSIPYTAAVFGSSEAAGEASIQARGDARWKEGGRP